MTKSEIIDSIKFGENQKMEIKSSFGKGVIETVVAFSNTGGGRVIIGCNDAKEIMGVTLSAETLKNWINEIKQNTQPQVIPEIYDIEIDNKKIVVIEVSEYPVKPVNFKNKYYKRVANSNHLMSVDEIANEYIKTINGSWDFYPDGMHGIESISMGKVKKFIQRIEKRTDSKIKTPPLEFLKKLEFIRNDKLTYGAYLLFVKENCLISDVQAGRFKSETAIIDSISINSDLFTEVDEIIAFLKKHLMVEYIITGNPQREERFDYPPDAIREIVVNMIVHRDYRDSSGSVIKIFDNRIEFYNPGKLFGDITVKDLLANNYISKARNKLIARAFKEAGIIEKYGSGIKRVFDICKDHGVIPPIFEEVFNGFRVVLFKERLSDKSNKGKVKKLNEPVNVPVNGTLNGILNGILNGTLNGTLNSTQQKVFDSIKTKPNIKAKEIAIILDMPLDTLNKQLRYLTTIGLIERRGSKKTGGYYVVH